MKPIEQTRAYQEMKDNHPHLIKMYVEKMKKFKYVLMFLISMSANAQDTLYNATSIKIGKHHTSFIMHSFVDGKIVKSERTNDYDLVRSKVIEFKDRRKYKVSLKSDLLKENEYCVYPIRRN